MWMAAASSLYLLCRISCSAYLSINSCLALSKCCCIIFLVPWFVCLVISFSITLYKIYSHKLWHNFFWNGNGNKEIEYSVLSDQMSWLQFWHYDPCGPKKSHQNRNLVHRIMLEQSQKISPKYAVLVDRH